MYKTIKVNNAQYLRFWKRIFIYKLELFTSNACKGVRVMGNRNCHASLYPVSNVSQM